MSATFKKLTCVSYAGKKGMVLEDRGEAVVFQEWKDYGSTATGNRHPAYTRPDDYQRLSLREGDSVRTKHGAYMAQEDMVVWVLLNGDGPDVLLWLDQAQIDQWEHIAPLDYYI